MPAGVNRVTSSPFTLVKGDAIMTPNVLFEQLLVVALVLICLLMHVWGPSSRSPAFQGPFKPPKPRRKRAKDPKPFTGYIHKPLCEACEQGLDARLKAPGVPPPMIIFTRGHRRTVDTSGQFCPDHDCSYHGWLGRGNIRANGHPGGQRWRQLQCVSCQGYFSDSSSPVIWTQFSFYLPIHQSLTSILGGRCCCLHCPLDGRGTCKAWRIRVCCASGRGRRVTLEVSSKG